MMECENIARLKGLTCAFLSTTDQQPFYKSLGYEECEPINLYGLSTAFKDSSMVWPNLISQDIDYISYF